MGQMKQTIQIHVAQTGGGVQLSWKEWIKMSIPAHYNFSPVILTAILYNRCFNGETKEFQSGLTDLLQVQK